MSNKSNMDRIENNIEETLKMSDQMTRVEPSAELMDRLRAIPGQVKAAYDTVPKKVVWAVAASIAVLVFANLYSARSYEKAQSNENTTYTESYFSYLKSI